MSANISSPQLREKLDKLMQVITAVTQELATLKALTVTGDLTVGGDLALTGDLALDDVAVGGTLGVTGESTFSDDVNLADAKDINLDTTTGSKLGSAADQKLGLWGVTPVIQQASADQAAAAAQTQNTLTDNGAGTADQTVEDVADIALSTGDTYADSAVNGAVNTAIASISNNFKEMTTELALIKDDVAAIKTLQDATRTALVAIGAIKGSA